MSIEDLSEEEIKRLKEFYCELSTLAKKDDTLKGSHTIEEAVQNHSEKMREEEKSVK